MTKPEFTGPPTPRDVGGVDHPDSDPRDAVVDVLVRNPFRPIVPGDLVERVDGGARARVDAVNAVQGWLLLRHPTYNPTAACWHPADRFIALDVDRSRIEESVARASANRAADPDASDRRQTDLRQIAGGESGAARIGVLLVLAIAALLALASPALAKPPTYREAEIAAAVSNAIPGVLREDCVTESNSLCVNATLWKERTAVVILYASVDAGTSPMCPGFRQHSAAAARYLVALAASYHAPRSASTSTRALHARRAWVAAYKRLARCPSFRWAS